MMEYTKNISKNIAYFTIFIHRSLYKVYKYTIPALGEKREGQRAKKKKKRTEKRAGKED